ncbi:MAG: nicotinate-nucleotide adenylyltransferase [Bacteroidales bacterium]|nr:nicotinate-nucleotide adenylyltransferase [Bacteroidales bacterium]
MKKEKVGLYFGSFNPIHYGHLIVANHILMNSDLDKIWFVVSPQNPFKKASELEDNTLRLDLVKLAIEGNENFFASDVEFSLSQPSYTIDTLKVLANLEPQKEFVIIMGEDNLVNFHKWKNYQEILDNYNIYVYPRQGIDNTETPQHPNIHLIDAPTINISSTYIRELIAQGKDIRYLLPENVRKKLVSLHLYGVTK